MMCEICGKDFTIEEGGAVGIGILKLKVCSKICFNTLILTLRKSKGEVDKLES